MTILSFGLDPRRRNAALGVLGIFLTGIFLTWFPIQALRVPTPPHPVDRTTVFGLWQTLCVIVMPYAWAARRLGRPPSMLGLTRRNLRASVVWGCALYSLALAAFLWAADSPTLQSQPILRVAPGRAVQLGATMCLIAAGTDIATRGFILLSLAEFATVPIAVLMQNVFWLLGHKHEIEVLSDAFGLPAATGLFLLLGLLGDSIVLRTRNVVGLAVAHVLLNVVMISYLRFRA